jgi:hypothetical protein
MGFLSDHQRIEAIVGAAREPPPIASQLCMYYTTIVYLRWSVWGRLASRPYGCIEIYAPFCFYTFAALKTRLSRACASS